MSITFADLSHRDDKLSTSGPIGPTEVVRQARLSPVSRKIQLFETFFE
jgi:hypothetical protein